MKKFNLGGLILVLLGVLFLAESLEWLPNNIVGYLWPLILIVVGIYLFSLHNWKMNPGGAILILLGSFFLIDTAGLLPFSIVGQFWPLILVAVGIYLLVKK
ncbi:MAG: DUF5668 domain-containing protein [Desulfotomaculum sp.]|nr:DUF5668 domain-containing protein [Desulfotomaculum sp.]MCL0081160.1 DUF5668 domain-containing protein [Peptococcaceae bacterium]